MLKVPAVLGCGSRTFPSVAMASDVSDVAIAACSPSRGKGYGARTSRDGGVMAEPWLLVDGRWQQRFAEVEEKSTQQASRNQEFFTSDEEDGLGVTSRTGRVDLELEFAEHETVIAEFLSKVAEFGWANLEADAVDAASGFVKKLTGTTFTGGVGFDVYTGAATFVGMQADPFASGASGCDAESSVSLGESFAQLAVKEHGWSELKEHESPESLREEGCPESFYSGTLAKHAVREYGHCELEEHESPENHGRPVALHAVREYGQSDVQDRVPPESLRDVGGPESVCSGTLAKQAVKDHGQSELKEHDSPESRREVGGPESFCSGTLPKHVGVAGALHVLGGARSSLPGLAADMCVEPLFAETYLGFG